ncbi:MAG: hypothetical protein V4858_04335 [Pseudomonadota bacterium]
MSNFVRSALVGSLLAAPGFAFARGGGGGSLLFVIAVPLLLAAGWLALQVKGETWRMIGGFVIAASVILTIIGFVSSMFG